MGLQHAEGVNRMDDSHREMRELAVSKCFAILSLSNLWEQGGGYYKMQRRSASRKPSLKLNIEVQIVETVILWE